MKKLLITVLILGVAGGGGYAAYRYYYLPSQTGSGRVSSDSDDAVYVDLVSDITGYGSGTGLIDRYAGEVEAQATLEVKLESDRTVKECYVKEGDEVQEGQRLFIYDTQEDEDKLAQAQIDIEKAEGEIEVANQQIAQLEKEKASASSDDQLTITTSIMSEQNDIKQNEYEIKTNELEISQLEEKIASATVTAEMAGIIQKINDSDSVDYSYSSSSDSSTYITILALGNYRVKGTINEQNYNQINVGDPIIVYSRVDSSLTWYGTISEIKTDADSSDSDSHYSYYYSDSSSGSSNYTFYVELENSDNLLLGQHVYMEVDQGQNEQKDGLWLAEYYIMQEDGKAYVWMANTSNVLEKHEITLGEYDADLMEYEILDGLDAEDYIAYPMDTITAGAPVIYNDYGSTDYGEDNWDLDLTSTVDYDYDDTVLKWDDVDIDGSGEDVSGTDSDWTGSDSSADDSDQEDGWTDLEEDDFTSDGNLAVGSMME